ncbi:MAG: sigma-54-dependent transcriptional regulator, partial [Limisphaerales bacterium]
MNDSKHILIVDDDPGQRSLLYAFLSKQGFETTQAVSGEDALSRLAEGSFSMMISDVRMPGLSGLETLRKLREKHTDLPVLMVTAFPDIRDAVSAMQDGAVNYLQKPIDLDELLASVRNATGLTKKETFTPSDDTELPSSVVAESSAMKQVFRDAAIVAASDSRVLITGESGVGKEVIADVIHGWSERSAGQFIKINCAAIPENLLESELFGHRKGAFT